MGERPDPEEAPKLRPDQFQLHWQSNGTFLGWALGRVRPDNTMSVTHTTFGERPDYFPQAIIDALNTALELNGHCVVPLPVPGEQPAPSKCPRCGSDDPDMRILPHALNWRCTNPWHDDQRGKKRERSAPSDGSVFVQLPSAPEVARWFIETERAGEFQNLGGSAVRLSDNPTCSVWHLATVDHDEQMHYLLDVHTDGSHDLLYVTWGLREEMGCEWRQQPSDVMPWGYEALVWFAERIEFTNQSCGIPLVWMEGNS